MSSFFITTPSVVMKSSPFLIAGILTCGILYLSMHSLIIFLSDIFSLKEESVSWNPVLKRK